MADFSEGTASPGGRTRPEGAEHDQPPGAEHDQPPGAEPGRPPGIEHLQVIARGGFAAVYRGWQPAFNRWVAVKYLAGHQGPSPAHRFDHEARAVGSLSEHPHVVPVYEAGEVEGCPYLVMPYLTGGSLQQRMVAGPVVPAEAVATALAVADALTEAHRLGILHRDIKPANILFTAYGVPQLADFGVARLSDSTLTGGMLAVTVAYAAPEVLSGQEATHLSDVYSIGATLYAALRGAPPFSGVEGEPAVAQAMRVVHEQPEPLGSFGVSGPIAQVVERAMAKDPTRRYGSAAELRDALTSLSAVARPEHVIPVEGDDWSAGEAARRHTWRKQASELPCGRPDPGDMTPAATGAAPGPGKASPPGRPRLAPSTGRRRRMLAAAATAVILAGGGTALGLSVAGAPDSAAHRNAAPARPNAHPVTAPGSHRTAAQSTAPAGKSPPSTARASGSTSAGDLPPSAGGAASPAEIAPATLADTLRSYYALVDQHRLDQSWQWLSPTFQQRIGQAYYRQFWGSISQVQVVSVRAAGGAAAITLRYVAVSGATSVETADLGFDIGDNGRILIDTGRASQG